jgi:hypothetical protein
MVPMKNNVMPFPQPRHGASQVPSDDSILLYSLGGRRFAIQWIITEVAAKRAEVISMRKGWRRKNKPRSTQI